MGFYTLFFHLGLAVAVFEARPSPKEGKRSWLSTAIGSCGMLCSDLETTHSLVLLLSNPVVPAVLF